MRPAIWRRVAKIRPTLPIHPRSHSTYQPISSYLSHDLPPTPPPPQYPLYRPDPAPISTHFELTDPQYSGSHRITPDNLPSDRNIQKAGKARLSAHIDDDIPEYSEDDLRDFYRALVESGMEEASSTSGMIEGPSTARGGRLAAPVRRELLEGLMERLNSPISNDKGEGSSRGSSSTALEASKRDGVLPYVILDKAISAAVIAHGAHRGDDEGQADEGLNIPLGVVRIREWDALFYEFVEKGDSHSAEQVLAVMESHGVEAKEDRLTDLMELYASHGAVADTQRLFHVLEQGETLRDHHYDIVITAHTCASPALIHPAITLLSERATLGKPFPQSSYHIALEHLLTSSLTHQATSHTRALGWDLFTNMRLSAHSTPTRQIYASMMRSCASATDPQPERARDLWLECLESGVKPQREEYDAIIRALSSTKKTYLEAFDLLRQMLAKHEEATFVPFEEGRAQGQWTKYIPTVETFTALLEGTKRAGDLNRARWILTEVVRLWSSAKAAGQQWKGADEELMSGVFMTYAAWKPVMKRAAVRQTRLANNLDDATESQTSDDGESNLELNIGGDGMMDAAGSDFSEPLDAGPATLRTAADDIAPSGTPSTSTSSIPLTSTDAIAEANSLFQRIIADAGTNDNQPFSNVKLTSRLVNSYLSVHLAHAPLASAREAWDRTWSELSERGVKPNGWSHMQVLEKCSVGQRHQKDSRELATEWGQSTWEEYLEFARANGLNFGQALSSSSSLIAADTELSPITLHTDPPAKRHLYLLGLAPRQIERTWRAIIRLHALSPTSSTDLTINHLKAFHTLFPPSAILHTFEELPRTPFQIRMSDPTSTPEADVPPHLVFSDVKVLHERLLREGKMREVGWLKWVVSGYEGSLRRRREWRIKGKERVVREGRGIAKVQKSEGGLRLEG